MRNNKSEKIDNNFKAAVTVEKNSVQEVSNVWGSMEETEEDLKKNLFTLDMIDWAVETWKLPTCGLNQTGRSSPKKQ